MSMRHTGIASIALTVSSVASERDSLVNMTGTISDLIRKQY